MLLAAKQQGDGRWLPYLHARFLFFFRYHPLELNSAHADTYELITTIGLYPRS
jgi:hypothetical protein